MRSVSIGFSSDRFNELSDLSFPIRMALDGRCATNRYFQVLGNIHDIESYFGIDNVVGAYVQIFLCHWGHMAIIFMWVSANLFHIGCFGNYELWKQNPIKTIPIGHAISDPHFGSSDVTSEAAYSGIYNWLYTLGFTSVSKQVYNFVIGCELLAVASILLALVHLIYLDSFFSQAAVPQLYPSGPSTLFSEFRIEILRTTFYRSHWSPIFIWPLRFFCACFDLSGQRLNIHIGALIGFFSIGWSAHLIYLAIPVSRGIYKADNYRSPLETCTGNWASYMGHLVKIQDKDNHIFGSTYGAGESLLTFTGGLKPDTMSLYLSDIGHHHLAVGVLFVLSAHLYSSLYKGLGHRIRDVLFVNGNSRLISLHKSLHFQLSLACAGLATITSVVAQHMYSLTPYLYLSYDYVTTLALYLHHQYIASFLIVAALVHAGIFLIRDYTIYPMRRSHTSHYLFGPGRILNMKDQLISHLSWVCLYLGFHTLGLYIHNDTVVAFREQEKQILIEPVFAFSYQSIFSATIPLGPGDLLAHHAIGLGLHVTVLILFKGSLHGRGSKLMPDKINFAVSFACDGPTRGGTCDISAWDSNYLAFFWMLNTDAWLMFYFHWKHLTVWQNTVFQFDESSTYLNGWFRDYLWFNSGSLVNGYNAFGANDLSVLSWIFLGAHLSWATGFMFLISWRGYWQELIDIILVMHLKTPILYTLWNGGVYTPVALSIVQARFIGLSHFSAGFIFTYAAFVLGATS